MTYSPSFLYTKITLEGENNWQKAESKEGEHFSALPEVITTQFGDDMAQPPIPDP
jgi:hypothetical protein